MRHPLRFLNVTACVVAAVAAAAASAADVRDPGALAVARKTLDAMGGPKGFESLRTLAFDFVVEKDGKEGARYHHVWDRWSGRYRVEGKKKDGTRFVTLFNVQKPTEGRSWSDGKEIAGADLKGALEYAYARFINDTYWLLMPAKMLDPGVNLALEEPVTKDGKTYDVVRLTFNDVGLTPKDTYWGYVARDTGLMERWEMVLTGETAADSAAFTWTDWTQVGPVRISLLKTKAPEGGFAVRFQNVAGSTAADDAAFAAP